MFYEQCSATIGSGHMLGKHDVDAIGIAMPWSVEIDLAG